MILTPNEICEIGQFLAMPKRLDRHLFKFKCVDDPTIQTPFENQSSSLEICMVRLEKAGQLAGSHLRHRDTDTTMMIPQSNYTERVRNLQHQYSGVGSVTTFWHFFGIVQNQKKLLSKFSVKNKLIFY